VCRRVDRIWGIGLATGDERAASPETWRGLNLLGFALMEARHRLRSRNDSQQAAPPDPQPRVAEVIRLNGLCGA